MSHHTDLAREAQRHHLLLRVLWRADSPDALAGWLRGDAGHTRGLRAYQAHARALAAAYPTLQLLLALAQQIAEPALVWRSGWRVQVAALREAECHFARQVLGGAALGRALQAVHAVSADFDFQARLLLQLQRGWLAGAATGTVATA